MRKIKCDFCGADMIEVKKPCAFCEDGEPCNASFCDNGMITVLYCTNKECLNHPNNEDELDKLLERITSSTKE